MHRYWHFLVLLFVFRVASSQEMNPLHNFVSNSLYTVNPAAAGFDGGFTAQLTYSKSWAGIPGSPCSQVLSTGIRMGDEEFYDPQQFVNKPILNLNDRIGLGLSLYNETEGPLRHTGVLLAYAYHISVRSMRLSLGLSGMLTQYHLNTSEFKPIIADDPELYTNTSALVPDFNVGAMLYNRLGFVGLSASGLVNFHKTMDYQQTSPDVSLCAGYKYELNKALAIQPSLLIIQPLSGNLEFTINGKLFIKDRNWLLFSYQSRGLVNAGFGLAISRAMQLGYNYGINTNCLAAHSFGNHSVLLRVDVGSLKKNRNKYN